MSTEARYVVRVGMQRTGYSAETLEGALRAAHQVAVERDAPRVEVLDRQTGQSLFFSYPRPADDQAPVFASHNEASDWIRKGDAYFEQAEAATNSAYWAGIQAYAALAAAAYARAQL